MKESVIALVDCDSFFVSCEQSVDTSLKDKAVCVVGSERGCVLARSKEAKAMGIPMGHPYFMAKKEFKDCIYVFGNYELYYSVSKKVMNILREFSPTVEVYSVDEAFVDLTGLKKLYNKNYLGIVKMMREKIKEELDINVSIGVSSSKVLAKLASEKAKNSGGIYLIGNKKIQKELKNTKIEEIWGIGKKTSLLLHRWGVLYCDELTNKSDEWIKLKLGKKGLELKHELIGDCILPVKNQRRIPKSIQNTRSFPEFTTDINYIKNELNKHIHNSCGKLRHFGGFCSSISVMLRTKDFRVFWESKDLENETNFEIDLTKIAMELLEKIYIPNTLYRSCGVTISKLNYDKQEQLQLFIEEKKTKKTDKLAQSIQNLEKRFGKNIIKTGFYEK